MLRSIPGTSPVHLTLSLVSLPSSPSRLSFSLSPFPFRRAVNRSFLRSVLQTTTTTTSRRSKPDRLRSASLLTRISSGYLTDPHLRPHKGPGASSSSPVIIAQIDILGTSSCLSTVAQPSTHRTHLNHATRTRTTPPFRADSDSKFFIFIIRWLPFSTRPSLFFVGYKRHKADMQCQTAGCPIILHNHVKYSHPH